MLDWLKQRLLQIVEWFGALWKDAFDATWLMIKDAASWLVDQLLGLVVGAANLLDVSGLTSYVQEWGNVPAEVMNVLALLGIGTASAIIISAVGIRLVLQLIPFTRLGS